MEVILPKVQVKFPVEASNSLFEDLNLWEYVQAGIFPNVVNSLEMPCLCFAFSCYSPSPPRFPLSTILESTSLAPYQAEYASWPQFQILPSLQ